MHRNPTSVGRMPSSCSQVFVGEERKRRERERGINRWGEAKGVPKIRQKRRRGRGGGIIVTIMENKLLWYSVASTVLGIMLMLSEYILQHTMFGGQVTVSGTVKASLPRLTTCSSTSPEWPVSATSQHTRRRAPQQLISFQRTVWKPTNLTYT